MFSTYQFGIRELYAKNASVHHNGSIMSKYWQANFKFITENVLSVYVEAEKLLKV